MSSVPVGEVVVPVCDPVELVPAPVLLSVPVDEAPPLGDPLPGVPLLDVPAPDVPLLVPPCVACAPLDWSAGLTVSPRERAFCSTCSARDGSVLSRISAPDCCACAHPAANSSERNKGVTTRFI